MEALQEEIPKLQDPPGIEEIKSALKKYIPAYCSKRRLASETCKKLLNMLERVKIKRKERNKKLLRNVWEA